METVVGSLQALQTHGNAAGGGYHGMPSATTVAGTVVRKELNQQRYLSAALSGRLAAIDIGSNSVRLIVAEAIRGGNYRILDEEREPTRLGRSVGRDGNLDVESMEQTLAALNTFKQIAAGFQAESLRVIATCAGDLDCSGDVGFNDLTRLLGAWGPGLAVEDGADGFMVEKL